jgi:hypothetical protein
MLRNSYTPASAESACAGQSPVQSISVNVKPNIRSLHPLLRPFGRTLDRTPVNAVRTLIQKCGHFSHLGHLHNPRKLGKRVWNPDSSPWSNDASFRLTSPVCILAAVASCHLHLRRITWKQRRMSGSGPYVKGWETVTVVTRMKIHSEWLRKYGQHNKNVLTPHRQRAPIPTFPRLKYMMSSTWGSYWPIKYIS